ncbi:IS1182 family transposase [Roseivirga spongicola]|uniref:IS1182 family transposase n=1 Tax=Roseivirga spongicola TaxID=333140 RepID=UPI002AC8DF8D|nr:IS1182 family transposase [Roseivirga spongicola]WPZ09366.1 IS1182 family transposase [Roseivirga spongicola]
MTNKRKVFKDYHQDQLMLLPPSLEELISPHHPVRLVNSVIDRVNTEVLERKYKGGGSSSYHPKMLLKVLVYGYLSNVYSSRKLEASLAENIHFMWISGMSKPDHNTLARFRSDRLKDDLKVIFAQVVQLLVEEGMVGIKELYTDGTKIEANANRYSFVWGKAINTSKERIGRQLEELWEYTQRLAEEELSTTPEIDFKAIDANKVEQTVAKIDRALSGKRVSKKVKQKLNYAKKNWPGKLREYEQKQAILQNRNSYSKTDHEATFMRMKDDHMLNGQLKPAYNWQISTSSQFIVNTTLHQTTTDTQTLKPHLEQFKQLYNTTPKSLCADAGYGSEENYSYLQEEQVEPYVKYNYFHKEQTKKWQQDPFKVNNLHYDEQSDKLYCPMGQPMEKTGEQTRLTKTGYQQHLSLYKAKNCNGCPLRPQCHKAEGNRTVQLNHGLRKLKEKVRRNLHSDEGLRHRANRPADVEATFGIIKHNKGFKRFMLRGLEKVEIETLLISIAHNISKMGNLRAA